MLTKKQKLLNRKQLKTLLKYQFANDCLKEKMDAPKHLRFLSGLLDYNSWIIGFNSGMKFLAEQQERVAYDEEEIKELG